jgi:hypothetical protein
MSNITASSFFKTKKGQVLSDFKHLLTEKPSNSNTNSNLLSESENSYDLLYAFDKKIATPTYEYYYGFSFPNGATYNYDAKLLACQTDIHLSQYQPDTEEALTKALEKKLQTIGFAKSPNNNYYMTNSKTGTSVGIGYENGHVTIIYAYDTAHTIKLVRTPRNDEIRANTMNLGLGIIENDSVIEYEDEDDLADYD